MFNVGFGLDSAPLLWELDDIEHRQLPFVQMLAATRLAQRVKKGMLPVMKARLDRPTPTTMNSLFVKAATKAGKPAEVYFKDSWASGVPADVYLQQAVSGGMRPHKRFEKALIARGVMQASEYAVPTAQFMNQYGNVSRGTMTKILSGLGASETRSGYQANASDSARSKRKGNAHRFFSGEVDGTRAVWERKTKGDEVRPVFVFSASAPRYRTIFPFFKIGQNIVKAGYSAEVAQAFADARATSR
ncbi:hypothetical protein SRABI123_01375 [Pseudomonas sp. Bi123]|uniref:hypothetical protein n=1 Tax=Pseudomonas sp. Bi123 TaxID=2821121 RepID=UPI001D5F2F3F|nr:hypothetical protein [Pseudomonas sp. Bi123]CAH0178396.1 hypothetical protein SRABI123_01375 [Pseudomonas sp. Bi123]